MTPTASVSRGPAERQRLAELLAAVSLATDLAHEVPPESALRVALLALDLGRLAGWAEPELSDAYYVALLYHLGCTGAVVFQSRLGWGDDVATRHWLAESDMASRPQVMRIATTRLARRAPPADWGRAARGYALADREAPEAFAGMAEVASRLAERLGAPLGVSSALRQTYGRWDGRLFTGLPRGDGLSPVARLVHLAHVAEAYHQRDGLAEADAVVRRRAGSELDPGLARLWLENSGELCRSLTDESVWEEVLDAEPSPQRYVGPAHVDDVTAALGDFVDMQSPYTRGHSSAIGELGAGAAHALGMGPVEVATVRRAGRVHDLGNVSVPARIFARAGSLSPAEWERVRLHPYHGRRMLSRAGPLRDCAEITGMHHERLDGSGYPAGLSAASLPLGARIVAAAEVVRALGEDRSWRPALPPAEVAATARAEVTAARLDREAVEAVLAAAGHPPPSPRQRGSRPAGLTDREAEVLGALARGRANKEIARELRISPATVHTHILNIYGKTGVTTRAGATLFALENDLVRPAGP